jgi:hypothetical protein
MRYFAQCVLAVAEIASSVSFVSAQEVGPDALIYPAGLDRTALDGALRSYEGLRDHRVAVLRELVGDTKNVASDASERRLVAFDYTTGEGVILRTSADTRVIHGRETMSGVPQPSTEEIADAINLVRQDARFAEQLRNGGAIEGGFAISHAPNWPAGTPRPRLLEFRVTSPEPGTNASGIVVNLTDRSASILPTSTCCGSGAPATPGELRRECDPPRYIEWPAANPVWTLCWVPPNESSGGDNSGLEITNVTYRGRSVLKRAHVPVLNVKYLNDACGPYRDWLGEMVRFQADNVLSPGYAEPTMPVRLVCDSPGQDVGNFIGVAAEKLSDRLVLTSQTRAGWYRYGHQWIFHLNGTLECRFLYSHVQNFCVNRARCHHAYFRLDLDIDGPDRDVVERRETSGAWTAVGESSSRRDGRPWRVRDTASNMGFDVIPSAEDNDDTFPAYSVSDMWALKYNGSELDDGGSIDTRARMDRYVNGENIDGADVVLWYRAGAATSGGLGCEVRGPTLRAFGF